jgi:hypothetical protein
MDNLELYKKFKQVPAEAKKTITGGRLKGFTDINPMWRIKQLTEQFGASGIGWYTEIVSREIVQGANEEKAALISLNLFVKIEGEWSKPIYGEGGSMFVTKEKAGLYTSDEAFKMAYTDALSIACKSLGMAADVYFEKDRTKYDVKSETTNPEPAKVVFDAKKIKKEIEHFTTKSELAKYWTQNKELQSLPEFEKLISSWATKLN